MNVGDIVTGRIALGGAGWSFEPRATDAESIRTVRAAIDAGVTVIDTARVYTKAGVEGHSESIVRRALEGHPERDRILVVTKGGHFRSGDDFLYDASPAALRRDVELSLRALGRDSLQLYLLHRPDPAVPLAASMAALEQLRSEGLIERIGVSNVDAAQLAIAEGETTITAIENQLSIVHPDHTGLLERTDLLYLAYSTLGAIGGADALVARHPAVGEIARERGASVARVAIAWALSRGPQVVAIVGATRPETIVDSAVVLELSPEELTRLDSQESSE